MNEKIIQYSSYVLIFGAIIFLLVSDYLIEKAEPTLDELGYIGVASLVIEYAPDSDVLPSDVFRELPIRAGWTAADMLNQVSIDNNIGIQTKDYGEDMGVFIESINGIGVDMSDGKWWQFWVNGEYSNRGASQTPVNNDDLIEFKYTGSYYENDTKN